MIKSVNLSQVIGSKEWAITNVLQVTLDVKLERLGFKKIVERSCELNFIREFCIIELLTVI